MLFFDGVWIIKRVLTFAFLAVRQQYPKSYLTHFTSRVFINQYRVSATWDAKARLWMLNGATFRSMNVEWRWIIKVGIYSNLTFISRTHLWTDEKCQIWIAVVSIEIELAWVLAATCWFKKIKFIYEFVRWFEEKLFDLLKRNKSWLKLLYLDVCESCNVIHEECDWRM